MASSVFLLRSFPGTYLSFILFLSFGFIFFLSYLFSGWLARVLLCLLVLLAFIVDIRLSTKVEDFENIQRERKSTLCGYVYVPENVANAILICTLGPLVLDSGLALFIWSQINLQSFLPIAV